MTTTAILGHIEVAGHNNEETPLRGAGNSNQWLFETTMGDEKRSFSFNLVDFRTRKTLRLSDLLNVQISQRKGARGHFTWSGPNSDGEITIHSDVPKGGSATLRVSVGTYHSAQR